MTSSPSFALRAIGCLFAVIALAMVVGGNRIRTRGWTGHSEMMSGYLAIVLIGGGALLLVNCAILIGSNL